MAVLAIGEGAGRLGGPPDGFPNPTTLAGPPRVQDRRAVLPDLTGYKVVYPEEDQGGGKANTLLPVKERRP